MSTCPIPPAYGEPWRPSSVRNCIYTNEGKLEDIRDGFRDRSLACVNACAGMADPIETITNLRRLEQTFDLQYKSDMRAIKKWQKAHPGNELTWPDSTKLSVWLMEELELSDQPCRKLYRQLRQAKAISSERYKKLKAAEKDAEDLAAAVKDFHDRWSTSEHARTRTLKIAEDLARAANRLMDCAERNITTCTDDELREAVEKAPAPEIRQQAQAFLDVRAAIAAYTALTTPAVPVAGS